MKTNSTEVSKLKVYAYGIKPLYGSPNGEAYCEPVSGYGPTLLYEPYAFLHYWVDDSLQYHEELKDSGAFPELLWITGHKFKVTLNGPNDFTVST